MNDEQREKLEFADEKVSTARLLLKNQKFEDAVSRAYYGMFHSAKALLLEKDSDPKTHSGTASELGKLFRKELGKEMTRDFSRIQEKRQRADYGELKDISSEEAEKVVEKAGSFVSKIKNILKE